MGPRLVAVIQNGYSIKWHVNPQAAYNGAWRYLGTRGSRAKSVVTTTTPHPAPRTQPNAPQPAVAAPDRPDYCFRPVLRPLPPSIVYVALFAPLRVSRRQFRRVLQCMRSVRHLKCHELYAHEKVTKVDSLSLVLSGKLVVSQSQRALHIVFPHHFLDSPEWFGVSTDEYFQVSIMAMEESRVLVWHRDKLKLSIMSDGFLQAVFDHILGRDVVHKLMQVSETMAASNGHLPNCYEEGEDKPMLVVKKAGDGPGITALLNRQLQVGSASLLAALTSLLSQHSTPLPALSIRSSLVPSPEVCLEELQFSATDPNAWRLGRIEENDHETPV
uniref:Blood vessel epicardial substance n=1 Tax=Papilio machaon TaxID=76193 RepID=A0A194RJT0_PAPMA|nr:Blood vessel epicardial substance [Papilio machaon]